MDHIIIVSTAADGKTYKKPGFGFNELDVWVLRLFMTDEVINEIDVESWKKGLERHLKGDWGECNEEQRRQNDRIAELEKELPARSIYRDTHGREFWIETIRNETSIMLPRATWEFYDVANA